jgi:copper homeostasis protein
MQDMNLDQPIIEACVEDLNSAVNAEQRGASKIELCGDLSLDGITPDRALIRKAFQKLKIPIKVMIRPRGGDFNYSNSEFEDMVSDIRFCRELGITEIVTGILDKNNKLDLRRLKVLGAIASPMEITIHKCIDETENPISEIHSLKAVPQVKSILTSGKRNTALEGATMLKDMVDTFRGEFIIIPAGKITPENLEELHSLIGADHYHGRRIV